MDATLESAQLNVRMSKKLRDEGTNALGSRGYTPAEFVRHIWRRLAQRGESLDELVRIANQGESDSSGLTNTASVANVEQPGGTPFAGDKLWREFARSVSLDEDQLASSYENPSYAAMIDTARSEQFGTDAMDCIDGVVSHE